MLYLYCLSDEVTARILEGAQGVAGAEPRIIDFDGLCVVASDFAEAAISVTRENVLAHERVVGRVLSQTTPLPFRFGTITNPERIESYVASQKSSLSAALERVRGTVEMSVKLIWNIEEVRREATTLRTDTAAGVEGAGTKFLLAKRRELSADERLKARAGELQAWLEEVLRDVVRESFVQVNPAEKLFLTASHLVERARLEDYRARLETARTRQPDLHFLKSGPWAPYSFSSLFS